MYIYVYVLCFNFVHPRAGVRREICFWDSSSPAAAGLSRKVVLSSDVIQSCFPQTVRSFRSRAGGVSGGRRVRAHRACPEDLERIREQIGLEIRLSKRAPSAALADQP